VAFYHLIGIAVVVFGAAEGFQESGAGMIYLFLGYVTVRFIHTGVDGDEPLYSTAISAPYEVSLGCDAADLPHPVNEREFAMLTAEVATATVSGVRYIVVGELDAHGLQKLLG
jgi:hypothetical protein